MDSLIGKSFGPYEVRARIGEGGMAVVYRGFQESLNRTVAIKVLRSDLARDQTSVKRFVREALDVAQLSHPNILHVYDAGAAHGVYYIVMDFAPGGSLQDLIARGPVDPRAAVSLVAQIADALDYAHRNDLVHRDVKPSNILLGQDGQPKLCDFGIAKALREGVRLTRTGESIGTPAYMAPEQAEGLDTDGRTDIYSLGIVLYELLTGRVPFSAPTPMAVLYQHLHTPPPPLRQANPNIPDWLESVISMALAKRPESRFQKASAFARALRQGPSRTPDRTQAQGRAAGRVPSGPSGERTVARAAAVRPATERGRRRNVAPILVGVIVLVILGVAAAAAMLLWGGGDRDGEEPPAGSTAVVTQSVVTRVITPGPQRQVTRVVTPSGLGRATAVDPDAESSSLVFAAVETPAATGQGALANEPANRTDATAATPEPPSSTD